MEQSKEKLVKHYIESLINTMIALSCRERNSLERIDNIQYYFAGLKGLIIEILEHHHVSTLLIDEINKLDISGGIDGYNHTIDFRYLSVKVNEMVYLAVSGLDESNLDPLITKLHDFNFILDESLHNHALCGC